MSELQDLTPQPAAVLSATVEIIRAETGKTETYQLTGIVKQDYFAEQGDEKNE